MTGPDDREERKQQTRTRVEPFIRDQIAICERALGADPSLTRPERLDHIRHGIQEKMQAYWEVMADPVSDEMFAIAVEILDEIVEEVKKTAVH